MKVTHSTVKGMERNERETNKVEIPPLTLLPDEEDDDEKNNTKTGSFKLKTDPADANSPKYSFTMAYADGTQSVRFHIQWVKNVKCVLTGMNVTTGMAQVLMIKQLCHGTIQTTFTESIEGQREDARIIRARAAMNNLVANAGETPVDFRARQALTYTQDLANPVDDPTTDMVDIALCAVITMVCPYKALEKQKRFMRRKMRKPNDMKVRSYVNHLHRVNFEEMPYLPPQGPNQSLPNDEIVDIVVYGLPKSWIREMDRQDFDPFRNTNIRTLVDFCERLESAEDFQGDSTPKKTNHKDNKSHNKKQKHSYKGKAKDGDKWCDYHESNTHNTNECSVLKKLKIKTEGGAKGGSGNKTGNKSWTRKSYDAKSDSKKELNAIVKQVSKKVVNKVKKDLNKAAKRKAEHKDEESSDNSVNMMEQMRDIDDQLKEFNFDEADKSVDV